MRLKVGILGFHHPHAELHLRSLEQMNDVEAIYIAEEDPARLAKVVDRPKVAGAFADPDTLLRREDVPVLLLMKPNHQALDLALRAVSAGKHLIGDKPMVRTADEMSMLVDAAARNDVLVSVFYCYRWRPQNRQIARLRRDGALGDRLLSVEMRMVTTAVALRDPKMWLFRKDLAGGGVLHWLGCHEIDWLHHITGEEVATVSAMVQTTCDESIDVEDLATVSMRLSGGALVSFHNGYLLAGGKAGYEGTTYDTYYGVRGTLGSVWTGPGPSDDQDVLLESSAPGWNDVTRHTFSYQLPVLDGYAGAYGMDFLRACFNAALDGNAPPVNGEDNVKVLRVVEAAYRSSRTGKTISL